MSDYRRAANDCGCCVTGNCVDAAGDCPDTVAFSVTVPTLALENGFNTTGTVTDYSTSMSSHTTAGTIGCANTRDGVDQCFLDYECATCITAGTCDDPEMGVGCGDRNYYLTTVPAVLKRCSGTDCTADYSQDWYLGTSSGLSIANGHSVIDYGASGDKTYKPTPQTVYVIPQIYSFDYSNEDYWEYEMILWFANPMGYFGSCGGSSYAACDNWGDCCGRASGMQSIIDNYPTTIRSGIFTVRKENDSCLAASWDGATQTARGGGVISITPPTGVGAGGTGTLASLVLPSRCTDATSPQSCTWTDCNLADMGGIGSQRHYAPVSSDTLITSYGGTCSWAVA